MCFPFGKQAAINKQSNEPIASGVESTDVHLFEGAWYFDPDAVDMTHLVVTEKTYICPYKAKFSTKSGLFSKLMAELTGKTLCFHVKIDPNERNDG